MTADMLRTTAGITVALTLLVSLMLCSCRPFKEQSDLNKTENQAPAEATTHLLIEPLTSPALASEPMAAGSETIPVSEPSQQDPATDSSPSPKIAIIIDDMGFHRQLGGRLLGLDLNLTFSFLPHAPFTADQAQAAHRVGRDILVHLPMEPQDASWDPGPDALMVGDSPERIREKTEQMLTAVPHAMGANNHMGSRFTEEQAAMRQVIAILHKHSLFFIDSFTTVHSQGLKEAQSFGLPSARRHIFLDNDQDPDEIFDQIAQLIALAHRQGAAIGIGHPYPATLIALQRCQKTICREIEIVGVHQLVR